LICIPRSIETNGTSRFTDSEFLLKVASVAGSKVGDLACLNWKP
jgi:hypothetical protein